MLETCIHLRELTQIERKGLEKSIAEDKYYLSKKAGKDVGQIEAEKHFMVTYGKGWMAGFKVCYCMNVCEDRNECLFAQPYLNGNGKKAL